MLELLGLLTVLLLAAAVITIIMAVLARPGWKLWLKGSLVIFVLFVIVSVKSFDADTINEPEQNTLSPEPTVNSSTYR